MLVRTAAAADPIPLLKEQVWRLDAELPVTVHVMDDVVGAHSPVRLLRDRWRSGTVTRVEGEQGFAPGWRT